MPEARGKGEVILAGHWPPISEGYWELRERAGLQKLVVSLHGHQPPIIQVPSSSSRMTGRLLPLLHVASVAAWRLGAMATTRQFSIQLHDEDPGQDNCLHFDAGATTTEVLLPDPYALGSSGYQQLRNQYLNHRLPPWRERLPIAFWRGASTGIQALTPRPDLPKTCVTNCVVRAWMSQTTRCSLNRSGSGRDEKAMIQIKQNLMQAGLLAPHCPAWMFGLHRFLIEIDGNVNSWGLLWKLLSGGCVLKVESLRRRWYHHRLKRYVHFIPISKDLSNLEAQLSWCHTNQEQCEQIANNGRILAEQEVKSLGQSVIEAIDDLKAWINYDLGRC